LLPVRFPHFRDPFCRDSTRRIMSRLADLEKESQEAIGLTQSVRRLLSLFASLVLFLRKTVSMRCTLTGVHGRLYEVRIGPPCAAGRNGCPAVHAEQVRPRCLQAPACFHEMGLLIIQANGTHVVVSHAWKPGSLCWCGYIVGFCEKSKAAHFRTVPPCLRFQLHCGPP
jgi:hypothetical protein